MTKVWHTATFIILGKVMHVFFGVTGDQPIQLFEDVLGADCTYCMIRTYPFYM